ncbi:winged helix-turn-helix transcriptional regulator [Buttiauxella ferragutiae]|jgi:DNA-binding HxlR family transcriptional regulator|uniref:HxlR family transcriptional regulator n=1 Tax=Buttiauxella ferragutiae ATCC 51602 TaxID=1354252 RepID=A0ABX2W7H8_9ENTR|nr:helix-turn-helix domain-containing protein [Buttiauxella ferragutiae]OAT26963.1 HxlR family transcriptional regulator [Buttiauxella ferragutiae ATCC 51602]
MKSKPFNCPVEVTIAVAGGKWKPLIIFHLMSGTKRFGELRRLVGNVSQRSLTLQLRELESHGIINRAVFAEVPPRVEYSLTQYGKTLEPVLHAMKNWGDSYVERNGIQCVQLETRDVNLDSSVS